MTFATTETAISPDVIAAENNAVRNLFGQDNPNPDLGKAPIIPDAPAGDEGASNDLAPVLSVRDQIAARAKARREAERAEIPPEELTTNDMGEFVPPWVKRQGEEAADEAVKVIADKAKAEEEANTKTYTLKVRGNDVPVASRAELMKLAEVDDEDAGSFTDAALIKLAQKQMAASAILDEAKQTAKSARQSARADNPNTTGDPADTNTDQDETPAKPAEHQGNKADWRKEVVEKIQFGDPEEAAAAFADAMERGVNEALTKNQVRQRVQYVETAIERAAQDFEAQNNDLIEDLDIADLVYNKALVAEFKKDLVAGGVDAAKADQVLGGNIQSAMQAYIAVAADGRVKVRTPDLMMNAAAESVRAKINRPAPTREGAPKTAQPSHDRLAAKRNLAPQPTRASVAKETVAQRNGQTPEARSSVVAKMRSQRGQA
jgi:hypothetical protein